MAGPAFVDCYGDLAGRLTGEMLELVPDLEVFSGETLDERSLIDRLSERRHVLVYMGYMSERVLRACPELKTIAYLSTGLATHGDLAIAKELGIRFEGVKGYGNRAVAEHAVTLALAGLKRLAEMDRAVRNGAWQLMRTEEFAGKIFGVLGLGGIGVETARIADALGARVIAWTPSGNTRGAPVDLLPIEEVLAQADILSVHLALTPETQGMIGGGAFAAMKPGVVLVNTARGDLIDETALLAALRAGQVSHAALDVFVREPLEAGCPLYEMDNVTLTPHSAWLTTQAIDRLLVAGLELLKRHISHDV
ncbi:D-isomer specific 2-hydroxyacid dehydrogenase family protein [Pelagibius sp. Alg239-R121]|uniref:NAD(P)-dependent oxidoreductase n=1 Tax=Pelagibius sp. Alg239-R121 TaxID=2993448 RepID=UPI0024A64AC5|nr:NAD(P)-dependent oxidoreductase [Pelagibius sp. Alg239-R121]